MVNIVAAPFGDDVTTVAVHPQDFLPGVLSSPFASLDGVTGKIQRHLCVAWQLASAEPCAGDDNDNIFKETREVLGLSWFQADEKRP